MVSTRGLKYKFSEGEKVLCYEPDPTKAKVLYDSKVLDVIVNKDQRGRKAIEYLIHFQGWNSSWDRCVSEDYVLKDTDENRQLQRDLAEKAQLQLGAYLYRRERKKRTRKLSDKNSDNADSDKPLRRRCPPNSEIVSSEDSYSRERDRDTMIDSDEDEDRLSVSTGDDSSEEGEDEKVPFEIGDSLKRVLEKDFELIKKRNKIIILPAEPSVVNILEAYVKHYAISQICGYSDKSQRRYRTHGQNNKTKDLDKIDQSVNLFKEIVDGIRIYFDFTLGELLLYNQEQPQYKSLNFTNDHLSKCDPSPIFESSIKNERDDSDNSSYYFESESSTTHNTEEILDNGDNNIRKKSLRSHRTYGPNDVNNESISSGSKKINSSPKQDHILNRHNFSTNMLVTFPKTPTSPRSNAYLRQILSWKIVPDSLYNQNPPPPSLIYGATHLTRLFVKLPELLYGTNMPDKKLKFIFKNLDLFLNYLEDHLEWFGEHYYRENNILKTY